MCRNSLAHRLTCPSWLAWFFAGDSLFNGHERATGSLSQLHLTASTRGGPRLSLQLWKVNAIILERYVRVWTWWFVLFFFFYCQSILNYWRGLGAFWRWSPVKPSCVCVATDVFLEVWSFSCADETRLVARGFFHASGGEKVSVLLHIAHEGVLPEP